MSLELPEDRELRSQTSEIFDEAKKLLDPEQERQPSGLRALFIRFSTAVNSMSPETRREILIDRTVDEKTPSELTLINAITPRRDAEATTLWKEMSFFFREHGMNAAKERGLAQINMLITAGIRLPATESVTKELQELVKLLKPERNKNPYKSAIEHLRGKIAQIDAPNERGHMLQSFEFILEPLELEDRLAAFFIFAKGMKPQSNIEARMAFYNIQVHAHALVDEILKRNTTLPELPIEISARN